MIEQQLLPPIRPSCRVSGVSPYKLHHDRVQLEGLSPALLVGSHSRNSKDFGHARDSAAPIYGRHRIAMVDFDFLWIHLCRVLLIAERSHQITRIATDSNPPAPHASALGCLTSIQFGDRPDNRSSQAVSTRRPRNRACTPRGKPVG